MTTPIVQDRLPRKTWMLPAEAVSHGQHLIAEVRGIVSLMASASESDLQPEPEAIAMASFTVNKLLEELGTIIDTRED